MTELDNENKTNDNLTDGVNSEKSGANSEGKESVDYKTYRKTIDEVKKLKAELTEKAAILEKINQEKEAEKRSELMQKGKLEEIVSMLQGEKEHAEKLAAQTKERFKLKAITSELYSVAKEEGCVNIPFLVKLIEPEDIEQVEVDENFFVNKDSLKAIIGKKREETKGLSLFKVMDVKQPKDANIRQDKETSAGFSKAEMASNPVKRKEYLALIKEGKNPQIKD